MSQVILGSGDLYLVAYSGTIPDDTSIEITNNNVGDISGGASLDYKPTVYEVENDKRQVLKRFITKEEVTFKSGVLNFDVANLQKLCNGTVTVGATEKSIKIGGATSLSSYLLHFVHTKDDGKKLRVQIVVTASDGFTLTFAKDKETIVDAVFKALSQTDGTLIIIRDQTASTVAAPLTFVCVDGTAANATKITSVSPTLTGGNSYMINFNTPIPAAGADLTGLGWLPYTLAADIICANNNLLTLVEVSTGDVVVKGGQALTVVV